MVKERAALAEPWSIRFETDVCIWAKEIVSHRVCECIVNCTVTSDALSNEGNVSLMSTGYSESTSSRRRLWSRYLPVLSILICLVSACKTTTTAPGPNTSGETRELKERKNVVETLVVPTETIINAGRSESQGEASDAPAADLDTTYRIGPGDRLSFRSFDDESLSMDVVVRYDGYISLQLVPDLKVQGFTREEAESLLASEYSNFYSVPRLSLAIAETSSKSFTVLGEVARPGEFQYDRPLTLIEAITAAGGIRVNQQGGDSFLSATGQLVKATIIRDRGQDRQFLEYDLRGFGDPDSSAGPFTTVLPGDIIHVPESANLVYVLGEVRTPSVYAISEGLTLTRLLTLAGGFNESTARYSQVILTREISDTETRVMAIDVRENMKTGSDVILEPGDIIYMPRKRLVNLADFIRRVTAPASTLMSFSQQVLSLYEQAYSAYYADDRYDLLYGNNNASGQLGAQLQQSAAQLQSILSRRTNTAQTSAILLQTLTNLQSLQAAPVPPPAP